MSTAWSVQDAGSRFGEVVDEALHLGPQTVTRQGEPVVVVVAIETWRRLSGAAPDFKAFHRAAPLDGLDLSRDGDDRPLRAGVAAPGGR
jgi:prevent-host-death family protein